MDSDETQVTPLERRARIMGLDPRPNILPRPQDHLPVAHRIRSATNWTSYGAVSVSECGPPLQTAANPSRLSQRGGLLSSFLLMGDEVNILPRTSSGEEE